MKKKYTAKFFDVDSKQSMSIGFNSESFEKAVNDVYLQQHQLSNSKRANWVIISLVDSTIKVD
mgnify:CR=1 FL=1|tara:strand:+ start:1234 stop:1422 length:189 start_codon:yes stop_codon:yes gene_type:complete